MLFSSQLSILPEALVIGLLVGSVYGLFSVGLSLVFGVMGIVNFAYGEFVMLGMYGAYVVSASLHLPVYAALPFVLIGAVPVGWVAYVVCFRGTEAVGTRTSHDQLIISLGLSIFLQTVILEIFGPNTRNVSVQSGGNLHLLGMTLPVPQLIAFGVALVATVALEAALARTDFGRAVRAIVADREVATLMGIRTRTVFPLAFILSTALAGLAGTILFAYYPASPTVGQNFILIAFVCVILGGLGDTRGAFIGGLIVGVIESLTATYWNPTLQDTIVYIAFVVTIMARPSGLFGRARHYAARA